jgi:GTPase
MNAGLVDFFGGDDSSHSGDDGLNEELNLPPEIEQGNIEYKLKIDPNSSNRLERLVTQMKWRLQEGLGEAIYELGVGDNGKFHGLNDIDMKKSLDTLKL